MGGSDVAEMLSVQREPGQRQAHAHGPLSITRLFLWGTGRLGTIFQRSEPAIHLIDNHLPGIGLEFELMFKRSLRSLNECEVVTHLVKQGPQSLDVTAKLFD